MGNNKSVSCKMVEEKSENVKPYFCRQFDDCYEIKNECLGRGMSGQIMTVICKTTQKEYALKTLDFDVIGKKNAQSEAYVTAMGLGQKYIVQLKDVFEEDNHMYLVMEKLNGGNLWDYFKTHKKCFNELNVSKIIKEIATALKFLHDHGIVHRDVKLGNILCSGNKLFPVKLGDFGLADGIHREPCCDNHGRDKFSLCTGTYLYFPPELAKIALGYDRHYTKQCDMWCLGVCLYLMLSSGEMPFKSQHSKKHWCGNKMCIKCKLSLFASIKNLKFNTSQWPVMSEQAKDLILKLLTKTPEKRYTADQVLEHPFITLRHF